VNKRGILKGANRKEATWEKTKLGEPFKEALQRLKSVISIGFFIMDIS